MVVFALVRQAGTKIAQRVLDQLRSAVSQSPATDRRSKSQSGGLYYMVQFLTLKLSGIHRSDLTKLHTNQAPDQPGRRLLCLV
jgi:hypothetical protein